MSALIKIEAVVPDTTRTGFSGVYGVGTVCGIISNCPVCVTFFVTWKDLMMSPDSFTTVTIHASYVAAIQLNT